MECAPCGVRTDLKARTGIDLCAFIVIESLFSFHLLPNLCASCDTWSNTYASIFATNRIVND
jgi:hypothetical protein